MMIAALTGVPRMAILAAMNSRPALAITFVAALLLAACAEKSLLVGYEENENFLSFNHPFTDAAAADVRVRAERICGPGGIADLRQCAGPGAADSRLAGGHPGQGCQIRRRQPGAG